MRMIKLFAPSFWLIAQPLIAMAEAPQSKEFDELIEKIKIVQTEYDVPVISAIIVDKDNVIWTKTIGITDRISKQPASDKTIFRIGSITKMFTGLSMAMLEEDNLLDLDDPVKRHMPNFPYFNGWEDSHPVRIKHLLEHTSGLTGLSWEEFRHPKQLDLHDAIMWKADERKTNYPPGMHKVYSNAGPGYASYLLEHISGKNFEDFVEERIFSPLNMQSAGFFPDEETMRYLPTGYDRDGHTVIPYWHMIYRAFGAINLRTSDMGNFIQFLLNKGVYNGNRLVKESTITRMETPTSTLSAKNGLAYGYGMGIYSYQRKGHTFYGHGGDADGYLSRMGYNRDKNLGYYIVINVFDHKPLTRIRHLLEDYIINDESILPPKAYNINKDKLKEYSGEYDVVAARFMKRTSEKRTAKISLGKNSLYIETKNKTRRLFPVTDNHFRYKNETVATSAFVYDDDGNLFFQDNDANYMKVLE